MPVEVSTSNTSVRADVLAAIRQASAATGAQFDYLLNTAVRESSLDPNARASTSSAAGLFQFIEETWLGAVKAYGENHGLGAFANQIEKDASGRHRVESEDIRQSILDLRFDPEKAAALAGELAGENQSLLERRLGRVANAADLYTAHFLGPSGAVKLLQTASNVKAADVLPTAAAANRHVFYDGARARSVGEVLGSIAQSVGARTQNTPKERVASETSVAPVLDSDLPSRNVATTSQAVARNIHIDRTVTTGAANTNEVRTTTNDIFAPLTARAAQLSPIVLSVLNALDPTRLNERERD